MIDVVWFLLRLMLSLRLNNIIRKTENTKAIKLKVLMGMLDQQVNALKILETKLLGLNYEIGRHDIPLRYCV